MYFSSSLGLTRFNGLSLVGLSETGGKSTSEPTGSRTHSWYLISFVGSWDIISMSLPTAPSFEPKCIRGGVERCLQSAAMFFDFLCPYVNVSIFSVIFVVLYGPKSNSSLSLQLLTLVHPK